MSSPIRLPFLRRGDQPTRSEPPFDPQSWSGALILMCAVGAVLWIVQIVNAAGNYHLDDRFGVKPRQVDGLWGVVTMPFLHSSYNHLFSNTVPLILIGWVVMLSGCGPGRRSRRSSSSAVDCSPGWPGPRTR